MLKFADLVALDGELRDSPALTLYLDGRSDNPAWRTAWRRALKQEETRLRNTLIDASHDERERFTRDVEALELHLAQRRGALDAPGWLGVIANGRVRLDAPLRDVTPTFGHWGLGVALAPFLCVPCADRGAWVVVADSRAVRVFLCDNDGVHRVDTVRTGAPDDADDATIAPRAAKAQRVTRGGVGREAAERERRAARERMLHAMAAHVRSLSPALPVFVGGTPQLAAQAVIALEAAGVSPVVEAPVLGARARVSEISRAVHDGLMLLRCDADVALVDEVVRRCAAEDLAAVGAAITGRALDERAVQTLALSDSFVVSQPEVAEVFVRSALAQDAEIRVVTGEAARVLEESGGAGVLLRFAPSVATSMTHDELATV